MKRFFLTNANACGDHRPQATNGENSKSQNCRNNMMKRIFILITVAGFLLVSCSKTPIEETLAGTYWDETNGLATVYVTTTTDVMLGLWAGLHTQLLYGTYTFEKPNITLYFTDEDGITDVMYGIVSGDIMTLDGATYIKRKE
jgi:hypothetical protein